jgi:hypothetical protein
MIWKARGIKRTQVVVPAEPASVTSINVHGNVGQVERLKSVRNTLTVTSSRVLAGLEVAVGDQVGKRIRLDDQRNGNVGVLLEDGDNGCIVLEQCLKFHSNLGYSRSMYSVLYVDKLPTGSSPLEALAAQSRPGRS